MSSFEPNNPLSRRLSSSKPDTYQLVFVCKNNYGFLFQLEPNRSSSYSYDIPVRFQPGNKQSPKYLSHCVLLFLQFSWFSASFTQVFICFCSFFFFQHFLSTDTLFRFSPCCVHCTAFPKDFKHLSFYKFSWLCASVTQVIMV